MAYLSLYTLSLKDIRALRLTDTYSLHRTVYSLFADVRGADKQEHSGILFADKGGDARGRKVLILSDRLPLTPEYGTVETRTVPPDYLSHKSYRFSITLNPVRRSNSSGKCLAVRGREAVAEWFCAKSPTWGFEVRPESLLVTSLATDQFTKGGQSVTLGKAELTGFLEVVDSELFSTSVLRGIGRARAFGCGLLQIVPAQ